MKLKTLINHIALSRIPWQLDCLCGFSGYFLMKHTANHDKKHYVYSLEDFNTLDIVYIGCTYDLYHRRRCLFSNSKNGTNHDLNAYIMDCKSNKTWPRFKILGEYMNFEIAHKMEVLLIKKIHPKFNICHNQ